MVVINLKNKFVFITLMLFGGLCGLPCAMYGQMPDLSGVIEDVRLNAALVNGLKQPSTTQTLAYLGDPERVNKVIEAFGAKISEKAFYYDCPVLRFR